MTRLSIIVPVYNEESFIKDSLERLTCVEFPADTEIIVIDDGSTDNTLRIIKEFKGSGIKNMTVITKENGGKGSAVREGIKRCSGNIITFHDADLEYNPQNLKTLLNELLKHDKNTVIYGSRFMNGSNEWVIPLHYVGNRLLSLLLSLLYQKWVGDMETCHKIFYADALEGINLVSNGFDIEPEITTKFLRKGLDIMEFPIDYTPRSFSEGKKINYRDGIRALFIILRNRFTRSI